MERLSGLGKEVVFPNPLKRSIANELLEALNVVNTKEDLEIISTLIQQEVEVITWTNGLVCAAHISEHEAK